MTEIKTWGDRLAEIPDGTITTSYHVTGAMQDEIDELRARLAQQAEMVEKCMVAMNENADRGMKAEQERDELRAALAKSQPVERGAPVAWVRCHPDGTLTDELMPNSIIEVVRKYSGAWVPLFARPVCPMSDEPVLGTKTWMEGGVVMTQNLTASDIYKPAPMSDDDFIATCRKGGQS